MTMEQTMILLPTSWGVEARYRFINNDSKILVVEFPGANYGTEKPIFHYTRKEAVLLGLNVLSIEYGYQAKRVSTEWNEDVFNQITADIMKVLDEVNIEQYAKVIFLSKSIGTIIAGRVSQNMTKEIYNLYLTPLKQTLQYVDDPKNCSIIVGDRDSLFPEEDLNTARELNIPITIIKDGDHGLEMDDLNRTFEMHKELTECCKEIFCKQIKEGFNQNAYAIDGDITN